MTTPPTPSITANFPYPLLTPFASDRAPPSHASLLTLQRELNANAMSVHSNRGGGRHGHLTLTVPIPRYLAISGAGNAFEVPVAPPTEPAIPVGATGAQTAELVRRHHVQLRDFQQYYDTDKALVRAIIAATPLTYIETLSDPELGFAQVTALQLLTHLHTTYGAITAADRDSYHDRMRTPWSPPTPIETLFQQLEEGKRMATLAAEPIADSQLVRIGQHLIFKTGLFPDGCREWRLKPDADQTWANFKTHFARHDRDRQETATSASAGYAGAVQPTNPPETPDGSACAVTALPSGPELIALLTELATLRKTQPANSTTPRSLTSARGYCWTHGSTTNSTHTSATCKNKAPGHVDTATWRNKCGGNAQRYVPPNRPPSSSA
jgi:hypothetical protein